MSKKAKRAKNIFIEKKTGKMVEKSPKTSNFYPTGQVICDKSGFFFEIYQRGKSEFYVDIPLGQNDLGIIFKGYFIFTGIKSHTSTLDFREAMEKIKIGFNKISVNEKCKEMLDKALMEA